MLARLKDRYNNVPPYTKRLVLKALLLLCAWKLLFWLVLVPTDIPDHQLKMLIGNGAAKMLGLFYDKTGTVDQGYTVAIIVEGKRSLRIAAACTGLELMALYVGVLLCMPVRSTKRLLLFIPTGIAAVIFINMLRCALLVWIYNEHAYFYDIAHKWVFKLAVYLAVFYGWTLYLKGYGKKAA
jgi:Transmembrane exosortase (Exosortase_EpsH).